MGIDFFQIILMLNVDASDLSQHVRVNHQYTENVSMNGFVWIVTVNA